MVRDDLQEFIEQQFHLWKGRAGQLISVATAAAAAAAAAEVSTHLRIRFLMEDYREHGFEGGPTQLLDIILSRLRPVKPSLPREAELFPPLV